MRSPVRTIIKIVACVVGCLIGAALGIYLGAIFGGNYATDFEFASMRGYEATGLIGLLAGLPLGGLLGYCLVAWLAASRRRT